jgi:predicted  nucleic acid-binding Zn-ribbon protein
MGDKLSMTEIDRIITLLQGNNEKLEEMNKSLTKLHTEMAEFKGEINKSLAETNGKLKGNHELLKQKFESMIESSTLHDEILENKIDNNTLDISALKEALKPVGSNSIKINILFAGVGSVGIGLLYIIAEKIITGG